ncbi:MAG TPA: ABC transporter ATP-binding protein, partial [Acetobacteraceae bacterium]|nr:ABC transporter ATP-binding protein [Acetobacteraceae bacterium]
RMWRESGAFLDGNKPGRPEEGPAPMGMVHELSPDTARPATAARAPIALRAHPLRFLLHYVAQRPLGHAIVVASVLTAVTCSVSIQYGLKHLIDIVAAGPHSGLSGLHGVWGAFLLLCGFIAADNLLWRVGGWAAANTYVAVTGDIRRELFVHLSGHSPSWFAERLPGALAGRVSATAEAAFTVENTGSWNVLPPCFAVVCSIFYIGAVNPPLAAALVAIAAALGALIYWLARRGTPLHRSYAENAANVDGELVDVISNIGIVRAFGAMLRERRRFGLKVGQEMTARRASLLYLEKLRLIHAALTAMLTAGVVAFGILLWQRGQATVGDIALLTALAMTILNCTRDLAVALVNLTQQVARLAEAIGALLTPHELSDAADVAPLIAGPGRVSFEQVRFAYPHRSSVLREFDLTIEPGQRVGLVGPSGAGKSTVLALLQRAYDVEDGRILIDGQDIRAVTQESLHRELAIVPQDISLFHRSVLENIRYARPDASQRDVLAAAETAHCRDFIEALPEGFATIVGDRGVKLSGGQRQRLAIARALLKDAPILLLDEATSALDSESERAIQSALDRLMQGRTVIAIAHRLSTLGSFDRIIVMDQGRIIDDGSPTELAVRPGPYRELLRKQHIVKLPEAA